MHRFRNSDPSFRERLRRISIGQWIGIVATIFVLAVTVWAAVSADGDDPVQAHHVSVQPSSSTTTEAFSGIGDAELDEARSELLTFLAEHHGSEAAARLEVAVRAEREGPDPSEMLVEALETAPGMRVLGYGGLTDAPWVSGLASYDPETDVIRVGAPRMGEAVRVAMLRAFVHALHVRAAPLPADTTPDAVLARLGLIEGDAARMIAAYLAGEDPAPDEDEREPSPPSLVTAAVEAGRAFLDDADEDLDDVLHAPPATTEQLLHRDRYDLGETGLDLPAPRAGERTAVGELVLVSLLGEVLDPEDAAEAGDGWGGDVLVAWEEGGAARADLRIVMDSSLDRKELVEALDAWRRWHGHARVRVDGRHVDVEMTEPARGRAAL